MSEDSPKVPSQIFKWFEKMKGNYEQSVQSVLKQFETYSNSQQERIDNSHNAHLTQLTDAHGKQTNQYEQQVFQLQKDVDYYRQQIDKQQKTIDELNTRYDAVIRCMIPAKNSNNIKDIFSEHDFVSPINNTINTDSVEESGLNSEITYDNNTKNTATDSPAIVKSPDQDDLFDQAILKRKNGESDQAFLLFQQAAKLGHAKSMGAMGRSFFLGEGTNEDPCLGLAWLINAANLELPQAVDRVRYFADNEPDLYQEAVLKSNELF
jgi:TPR repeat protein